MSAHINSWNDLQKYGINTLTGEACAYSMRILCDLSADGANLVSSALGLQVGRLPAEIYNNNWNSRVDGAEAVASVMLFREMLTPLSIFILFSIENCRLVIVSDDGSILGYSDADIEKYKLTQGRLDQLYGGRIYRNHKHPEVSVGDRNVHQATGRTL